MKWLEARLRVGAKPSELYHWLPREPESAHHFWDEPWWPGGYVVRLLTDADVEGCPAVAEVVEWDDEPDAEHFGDDWRYAQRFFEAASMLAPRREAGKLVHCLLNAHGLSTWGEVRFGLRFAWRRLTIPIRWRLYLRRRWERQGGAPVVSDD